MKKLKIGLLVLVSLFIVLFIPGQFAEGVSFRKEYPVLCSSDQAFLTILNPFQFKRWIPGYKGLIPVSGELTSPGSMNQIITEWNDQERKVVQLIEVMDQGKEFSASYEWKGWHLHHSILFRQESAGVIMLVVADLSVSGFFRKSFLFWGKKKAGDEIEKVFTNLNQLINQNQKKVPAIN